MMYRCSCPGARRRGQDLRSSRGGTVITLSLPINVLQTAEEYLSRARSHPLRECAKGPICEIPPLPLTCTVDDGCSNCNTFVISLRVPSRKQGAVGLA